MKMTYRMKWTVNNYRRDKRTGVVNPIKRSEYMKQLFKEAEQATKERV
ncbi:hypothetical protein [Virgibacillus litoralis]|uniref:Uncharacterized protein n=1 Tax=Virgibacillus litoralis TaxID=578221 RepID=A0ABS4HH80_9BACI|nr:hypothetical protein [Virgibacillus litoralis]MBP1950271.1 hypothetical protein [Virgibacillus litoralis]